MNKGLKRLGVHPNKIWTLSKPIYASRLGDLRKKFGKSKGLDSDFRRNIKTGRKNVALAEIEINGRQSEMAAFSGQENVGGYPEFLEESERILKARKTSFSDPNNRASDSAFKILDQVARELGAVPGQTRKLTQFEGTIFIVSDKPVCPSCNDLPEKFNAIFPNIKVVMKSIQSRKK